MASFAALSRDGRSERAQHFLAAGAPASLECLLALRGRRRRICAKDEAGADAARERDVML